MCLLDPAKKLVLIEVDLGRQLLHIFHLVPSYVRRVLQWTRLKGGRIPRKCCCPTSTGPAWALLHVTGPPSKRIPPLRAAGCRLTRLQQIWSARSAMSCAAPLATGICTSTRSVSMPIQLPDLMMFLRILSRMVEGQQQARSSLVP